MQSDCRALEWGDVNLPNCITLCRIFLVVVFATAASLANVFDVGLYTVAFLAFVIATFSDWLDGYLARRLNLVTAFGKLIDPLADKMLVCTAFVYLSVAGIVPVWVTALIIGREFLVTGIRQVAVEHGVVIPADQWGKFKTGFQLAFCIDGLIVLMLGELDAPGKIANFFQWFCATDNVPYYILLWVSIALTAWSGVNYTWKARHFLFK